jgi:hypothetical protein
VWRFSEKIVLNQNLQRGDDSTAVMGPLRMNDAAQHETFAYLPLKLGARLFRKASMPSRKSSLI